MRSSGTSYTTRITGFKAMLSPSDMTSNRPPLAPFELDGKGSVQRPLSPNRESAHLLGVDEARIEAAKRVGDLLNTHLASGRIRIVEWT